MQLLSQTDSVEAAMDHLSIRAKTLSTLPKELSPADMVALLQDDNKTETSSDSPTSNETDEDGLTEADITVDEADDDEESGTGKINSNLAASDSAGVTSEHSDLSKYAPAMIGLLAANLLVGLVLLALAVLNCIRRGATRGAARSVNPEYAPVKIKDAEASRHHIGSYSDNTPYSQ